MRISSKERRLIIVLILFIVTLDLVDLVVRWRHQHYYQYYHSHRQHQNQSHFYRHYQHYRQNQYYYSYSMFGGVDGLVLYSADNSAGDAQPVPHISSSDSWVSEELWPKEKSIIHIKLVKPLPKEIPIWELRNKDNYLSDLSLDFDSPYSTLFVNNCVISFKSYYDGFTGETSNQQITKESANIQAEISGGLNCKELPLSTLTPIAVNLTHLVVRDTGITVLTKFLFGANRLDKLTRLDVIGNAKLLSLQPRAFDGLTRLSYLSLINNDVLSDIALESFAGLKSLEELIFLGNGYFWDKNYFTSIVKSASDKILPNLIHLHLCKSKVKDPLSNNHAPDKNGGNWENNGFNKASNSQTNLTDAALANQSSRLTFDSSSSSSETGHFNTQASESSETTKEINNSQDHNHDYNQQHQHQPSGLKISKDDFQSLTQIKYLQLSDCDITYIHPSALTPLMRNLVGLNLASNPKLQVDNLKIVLSLFYVSNMKQLRWEAEQSQANSSFPNHGPSKKVGLDKLDLSYSLEGLNVPKDLLTVISKTTITELYMKNVAWKMIREGDIPPMPNLRVLHIDWSQIEYLDANAFAGLEELIKLSLKGNFIKEMPLYLLEPLRKLEYLDLSGYQLSLDEMTNQINSNQNNNTNSIAKFSFTPFYIPRKAFVHGTHIKEINLSYKNLTQLPRYLFIGLFKLERLHLRGCNLQMIEYLTFFPLKSIVYIDLSENTQLISNVRTSEEDTFVGLEAVEMIRLSNCNLTTKDIHDFNIWRRMHEHVQLLDLSFNHIDFINGSTLQNFSELRHIDLSHNQIKSWHNYTIFNKNSFITTLDISYNQITHISAEMLGDFRNLKNLSFASNPLQCECDWEGPLLLLDQKQKKLNQVHHKKIQDHIQQLVHRQQEIVSTAFASSQAPPKSIIEWLNQTTVHFIRNRHPLRSNGHYFCHTKSPEPPIVFKTFFIQDCPAHLTYRSARVSVGILMITVCVALLLAVFLLIIAFIYNTTIRNLLSMVDDDFLHNYQYDAFVSYNVNDSDWVFNKLVPCLEDIPNDDCCEIASSFIKSKASHSLSTSSSSSSSSSSTPSNSVKSNIKLCIYDRDFIAGRPISECITESIRNSRKVILVISNNFAQSPWCRFETDLAHNTLMDQNREGLILIKLEEMNSELLEKVAPQLHFLLKTRIYLSWSNSSNEQEIFWKKLRRALGFNKTYGAVKQYYKSYVGGLTKDRGHSVVLTTPINNNNNNNNNTLKDEIQVSFKREILSASRNVNDLDEIPHNDHDSGIAVADDSGCVSINGDENDTVEYALDHGSVRDYQSDDDDKLNNLSPDMTESEQN